MTTSKRLAEKKVAKFEKNITKRGMGPMASKKIKTELYVLAFFIVVVVGSYNQVGIEGMKKLRVNSVICNLISTIKNTDSNIIPEINELISSLNC